MLNYQNLVRHLHVREQESDNESSNVSEGHWHTGGLILFPVQVRHV